MKIDKCSCCGYIGACYDVKVCNLKTFFQKVLRPYCIFCFMKLTKLKKK